eukprot:3859486-Rhodomonas_salina.2
MDPATEKEADGAARTVPKASVWYAEVGLAVEKSATAPMPRSCGVSGAAEQSCQHTAYHVSLSLNVLDLLFPRTVFPTLENGGRTPSKMVLAARSAACACASLAETM